MRTIEFQKKSYPIRRLVLPEFGDVLISTIAISDLLLDDEGKYISVQAEQIDQQLFYFVEKSGIFLYEKL